MNMRRSAPRTLMLSLWVNVVAHGWEDATNELDAVLLRAHKFPGLARRFIVRTDSGRSIESDSEKA